MNICIGIISYLPDGGKAREIRRSRAVRLFDQCQRLLNLPIIVVAQNWDNIEFEGVTFFHFDKLGITGARSKLRDILLESEYDYFIMIDDDMELVEDPSQFKQYLNLIYRTPTTILEYKNYLLNMFGIPRVILEREEYDNIEAEKGEGFEDWIYVSRLKNKYKANYYRLDGLKLIPKPRSELVEDPYSTWITETVDKDAITNKSWEIIRNQK